MSQMLFCPMYSGSSGNVSYLEAGGARVLVDAGLTGCCILKGLERIGVAPKDLDAILITHEHADHIKGAGVLARKLGVPIYANAGTWAAMEPLIGGVHLSQVRVFETGRDFYIRSLNVIPFSIHHDAQEPVGFSFQANGKKVSTMTDTGHVDQRLLRALSGSDLVLIEANHDVDMLRAGRYPYPLKRRILSNQGHLSNEASAEALIKLYAQGVRNAILGHLSHENNTEEICLSTVRARLRQECIPDGDFCLAVAHRDRIEGMFVLE